MERTLEVASDGAVSRFTTRRLSRASLYGSKRRVPVDPEGRPCQAAALTRDGRFLLPPGSTATFYLDDHGEVVERSDLGAAGEPDETEATPERPEPAAAEDLLDHIIRQVYALDPVSIADALEALLVSSGICRLPDAEVVAGNRERFLVKNDAGYFLLAGEHTGFEAVGPDQADLSVPDTDEPWDDLDFTML